MNGDATIAEQQAGRPALRPCGCSNAAKHEVSGLSSYRHAYTLIELMVVIAIMAVVMTVAIPSLYRHLHPDSMQKAISDVMEACSHARAHAILQGMPTDVVIRADGGQISVQPAGSGRVVKSGDSLSSETSDDAQQASKAASSFSARLSERIAVEAAEINFMDIMEMDEARVRFYPNGTSDEFKMVLYRPDTGERRMLTLEVVTGLADVESDPSKFK